MRQLKLAMKMIKYSYGIKMNLTAMVLVGGIGIALEIATGGNNMRFLSTAVFFLALLPMFGVQIWYSMNSCELLLSSPWKKAADTSIPTLISVCGMLVMYTLVAALTVVRGGAGDAMQMFSLLWMAASAFLIMLLCGSCFKYFITSMIVFFLLYFGGSMVTIFYVQMSAFVLRLSAAAVIAIGYALILAGGLGQYLLSCLFYKKNVSKLAQGAALRKYM